jgi:regulatory protein
MTRSSPPSADSEAPGDAAAQIEAFHEAALAYLGRFATSAENLRRVLRRRALRNARRAGLEPDWTILGPVIEVVIDRLTRAGLLDDASYAEMRSSSLHRRGEPARRIRARLAAKGVERNAIDAALEEIQTRDPDSEFRAACRLALRRRLGPCRRAGSGRPQKTGTPRDRDLAALARAGFDYDTCRRVLDLPDEEAVRCAIEDGAPG